MTDFVASLRRTLLRCFVSILDALQERDGVFAHGFDFVGQQSAGELGACNALLAIVGNMLKRLRIDLDQIHSHAFSPILVLRCFH